MLNNIINASMIHENGIPSDRFTENVDNYLCAICREVYRLPVSINCGHTFCYMCLNRSELNFKNQCPQCRTIIIQSVPSYDLRMKINGFHMRCLYTEYGCTFTDACSRIEEHEVSCEYKHTECNKCEQFYLSSKEDEHLTNLCPFRPVECKKCRYNIPFEETKEHENICIMADVTCELCSEVTKRFLLDSHQLDRCPKYTIHCTYHTYGCDFTCNREDMKEHELHTNHVPIICSTMDKKITEWDRMLISQLQNGPFRVSGHGHSVVLCSDLEDVLCKCCKKLIPSKNDCYFGYQCSTGCNFALCLLCFGKQRLYLSKIQLQLQRQ